MSLMPRLALLVTVALLAAGCAAPGATTDDSAPGLAVDGTTAPVVKAPSKVVLAIQPTDSSDVIQNKAPEMERFLEARMKEHGVEADVEIYVPLSNVGVVEALRFGHADAAMMSAWPMVLANTKADAEVVLAEQREIIIGTEPQVQPYYYSYYVVLKDSEHQTLADLKGKSVAYTSPTSTSGYIFPVAKLVEDNLVPAPAAGKEADPGAFFGKVRMAGGYGQAWEALKAGQVDVAVLAGDINAKLYNEVLENTRIVATQGPVPSHGVVFAKEFQGTPEAAALQKAFLDMKGDQKDLMRKLVSGIFVEFKETTTAEHTAGLAGALTATGLKFGDKL